MKLLTELVDFLTEFALALVLVFILVGTFVFGYQLSPQGYQQLDTANENVLGATTSADFVFDTTVADLNVERLTSNTITIDLVASDRSSYLGILKNNSDDVIDVMVSPLINTVAKKGATYNLIVADQTYNIYNDADTLGLKDLRLSLQPQTETEIFLELEITGDQEINISEVILEINKL